MRGKSLAAYTFAHFSVDFACFVLLFGGFRAGLDRVAITSGYLLYNVVAFGLQAPIGDFCDRHQRVPVGLAGCCMVLAGVLLMDYGWPPMVLAALGNACFHSEGGRDSLTNSGGKMARSGIFVSSGAMGVALGTYAGNTALGIWVAVALLLLSMVGILLYKTHTGEAPRFLEGGGLVPAFPAAMVILFVAVAIRSYGGFLVQLPWKADYFLLPALAACLGKASGGLLADKLGARRVGALSLLVCIPLLCLWASPLTGFFGLLLFNMNMPITLCAVSDRLPGHPGLAFGVTTLALLCGCLPAFLYSMNTAVAGYALAGLCAASAAMIFFAVPRNKAIETEKRGLPNEE